MNENQLQMLENAKQAMQEERWGNACDLLETLYSSVPDEEVNKLLVKALYKDEQFQTALMYVLEFEKAYENENESIDLIIDVFLATNQFIRARLFIYNLESKVTVTKITEKIEAAENDAQINLESTIATNSKHFSHMGDVDFNDQQKRMENANQLPVDEYTKDIKFLLRDPFTSEILKSTMVQNLQQLKIDDLFTIIWIDGKEYEFNPSKIKPLEYDPLVMATAERIKDEYANDDPIMMKTILTELKMEMIFVYPYVDKVILNSEGWAELLIGKYKNQVIEATTVEMEQMTKSFEMITSLLAKVFKNLG